MTKEQEQLVIDNHKLIYEYMWKHNMYSDDVEDWYGLCAIGLCRAALYYTPTKGAQFSTLAFICMKNSCQEGRRKAYATSLQNITHIPDIECFNNLCPDLSYDPYIDKEFKLYVGDVLSHYNETTQQMICMRLFEGSTFEHIAKTFNCSKQNVHIKWTKFCKRVKNDLYR